MLVGQVIEVLIANYKLTDSIYIEWWDKEIFNDEDAPLTEDVWARAVEIAEDGDHSYVCGITADMLYEAISMAKEN